MNSKGSQKGQEGFFEGFAYKINKVDFLEQLCCCILDCSHMFSGGFTLIKPKLIINELLPD